MNDYTRVYDVGSGETDPFDRCRPSALLGFLQDAATRHADKIGAGRDSLVSGINAIWVLSRLFYELTRSVRGGEQLQVRTWHRGAVNAMFYRDFEIFSGGQKAGYAVSAWAILDCDTRRLLRPSQLAGLGLEEQGSSGDRLLTRIRLPGEMAARTVHTVSYGDLDINGHVNNTRYADFVCDAIGLKRLNAGYIGSMQINFLSECRPGEQIGIFTGEEEGKIFASGGKQDGKTCFEACAQLEAEGLVHG